jgi:light-regulated signal transduction histidine kinase (bacteriophytochrome)
MIPAIILNYLSKKKMALKFNKAYIYFAAFILLCGSTHFIDAIMFWVPMYRLNAIVRLATAIVSLATVYHLFKILPDAFRQPTNVELENEIKRRIEAENSLELTNRKLEAANRNLEGFAYIASHDLQEPLRKIRIYSSLLFDRNAETFDQKSRELAEKIGSSSLRMHDMVKDVLTLSTINADVHFTNVSLDKVVADALSDLEVKILETKAVIQSDKLPEIAGNKSYLTQLFFNLLANAMKFSVKDPVISITAETNADRTIIKVADNGIGMKEEDLAKIFLAFHRLHSKAEYEGSGIGLAICKKIVDVHNGHIEATSVQGKGTIFIITLPSNLNQVIAGNANAN